MTETTEYWFNLKTQQVEVGKQSVALYRVGPFTTHEEAEKAQALLAERAARWREEDEKEDD